MIRLRAAAVTGLGTGFFATIQRAGFGFRYLVSSGNEAVVSFADYLYAMARDDEKLAHASRALRRKQGLTQRELAGDGLRIRLALRNDHGLRAADFEPFQERRGERGERRVEGEVRIGGAAGEQQDAADGEEEQRHLHLEGVRRHQLVAHHEQVPGHARQRGSVEWPAQYEDMHTGAWDPSSGGANRISGGVSESCHGNPVTLISPAVRSNGRTNTWTPVAHRFDRIKDLFE